VVYISYTVKFVFLNGPPDPDELVLVIAGLGFKPGDPTTETVSQPVYEAGEPTLNENPPPPPNSKKNAALYTCPTLLVGTTLSNEFPLLGPNPYCDYRNTGWALLQTTGPIMEEPFLPALTVDFHQFSGDGIAFTIG
jgi:hypothetical protein